MNLPNLLTVLRILMVPLVPIFYYGVGKPWAMIVFILASLTDILDGYLARKMNQITTAGVLLDPAADKLMNLTTLITLFLDHVLPWIILVVMLLKELTMLILGTVFYKRIRFVMASNLFGKTATALFFIGIVLTFMHAYTFPYDHVVLYVALLSSVIAFVFYAREAYRRIILKEDPEKQENISEQVKQS